MTWIAYLEWIVLILFILHARTFCSQLFVPARNKSFFGIFLSVDITHKSHDQDHWLLSKMEYLFEILHNISISIWPDMV